MNVESRIAARRVGAVRHGWATLGDDDLGRVLRMFGLSPSPSLLIEHDRSTAKRILTELLWKDLAYGTECMSSEQAKTLACELIQARSGIDSRYFSNSAWTEPRSYSPLTDATYDAGLLIQCTRGHYYCIWFEDED
jgi:hypothetical protein